MNLNPFRLPTVAQQAADDLAVAELELLKAHTTAEHAQAMLTYRSQQVARLRALVAAHDQVSGDTVRLPVINVMLKGGAA